MENNRANKLKREIVASVNMAAAAGLDPDEAMAAVAAVLTLMIGRVRDPKLRQTYVDMVVMTIPTMVGRVATKKNPIIVLN